MDSSVAHVPLGEVIRFSFEYTFCLRGASWEYDSLNGGEMPVDRRSVKDEENRWSFGEYEESRPSLWRSSFSRENDPRGRARGD